MIVLFNHDPNNNGLDTILRTNWDNQNQKANSKEEDCLSIIRTILVSHITKMWNIITCFIKCPEIQEHNLHLQVTNVSSTDYKSKHPFKQANRQITLQISSP